MGINESALMSSERQDWETPQDLFDALNEEFKFTLDAAASKENAKVTNYYDERLDGLSLPWPGNVWLNPPYGRAIKYWIEKAYEESRTNARTVVVLMPARTDTAYFHDYVMKAWEIRFIRGRLKFVGAPASAPFPSMIVVFHRGKGMPRVYTANKQGLVDTVINNVNQKQIRKTVEF